MLALNDSLSSIKKGGKKMPDATTLIDVTMTREHMDGGYAYAMRKATPFGDVSAYMHIDEVTAKSKGMVLSDGDAYTELCRQINDEENSRLMEGTISAQFGTTADLVSRAVEAIEPIPLRKAV